MFVNYSLEPGD